MTYKALLYQLRQSATYGQWYSNMSDSESYTQGINYSEEVSVRYYSIIKYWSVVCQKEACLW